MWHLRSSGMLNSIDRQLATDVSGATYRCHFQKSSGPARIFLDYLIIGDDGKGMGVEQAVSIRAGIGTSGFILTFGQHSD